MAGLIQHDRELLAAVARHEVERPARALAERHGNGAQTLVARLVAIMIVVVLEAIDIREQHRNALLLAHRLLPGPR